MSPVSDVPGSAIRDSSQFGAPRSDKGDISDVALGSENPSILELEESVPEGAGPVCAQCLRFCLAV